MGIMDKIANVKPKTSGETFLDTVIGKLIDNLPPETLQHIKYIADTVRGFDEKLSAIEKKLAAINARLDGSTGKRASSNDIPGE